MTDKLLPDWHRAYGEPLLSGRIRSVNADFQVDEKLGFELSEDGEHDYLQIQKDGATLPVPCGNETTSRICCSA